MKIYALATIGLVAVTFTTASAFCSIHQVHIPVTALKAKGYVPKGFTPAEWELQKEKDQMKKRKHKHFKSRPMNDFVKDLKDGKVRHLFPVMFAKEEVKKHHIRPREVPYMQREEGSYDNSDVNVGYVPDGMTPHEWHDIQKNERKEKESRNFSHLGPQSFKSRSLTAFQKDLASGKVGHLFPEMFAKEKVEKGIIKEQDVPYMQRGGNWDNSDVRKAPKLEWSDTDKMYEEGKGPFQVVEKPKRKFFDLLP